MKSNCRAVSSDWLSLERSKDQGEKTLWPDAPELAARSMVSISGDLFNEPSTGVTALLTTVGSTSANAEDAGSIGRRNNCFILWYKDINLIFVYIRASFQSLTGGEPHTEHRVKQDRKRSGKAAAFSELQENCWGLYSQEILRLCGQTPTPKRAQSQRENSCFHWCFSMVKCFDKSIEAGENPTDVIYT